MKEDDSLDRRAGCWEWRAGGQMELVIWTLTRYSYSGERSLLTLRCESVVFLPPGSIQVPFSLQPLEGVCWRSTPLYQSLIGSLGKTVEPCANAPQVDLPVPHRCAAAGWADVDE